MARPAKTAREIKRQYEHRYLTPEFPRTNQRINRGLPDDRTRVTCWCEDAVLEVPRALVLEGMTGSCGHSDCRPGAGVVVHTFSTACGNCDLNEGWPHRWSGEASMSDRKARFDA